MNSQRYLRFTAVPILVIVMTLVNLIGCANPSPLSSPTTATSTACATATVVNASGTPTSTVTTLSAGRTTPLANPGTGAPPTFSPETQATMDARVLQSAHSEPTRSNLAAPVCPTSTPAR